MTEQGSLAKPLVISVAVHLTVLLLVLVLSRVSPSPPPSAAHALQAYLAPMPSARSNPSSTPPAEPPPTPVEVPKPAPVKAAVKAIDQPPPAVIKPTDVVVHTAKPSPSKPAKQDKPAKESKPEHVPTSKERAQELAKIADEALHSKTVDDAKRRDAQVKAEQLRARQAREADLSQSLSREEERSGAIASGAQARYAALLAARFEHNWVRPPSARKGLSCEVKVSQVPGGVVTAVKIAHCNGDSAVEQSLIQAVYRSSPLPPPEDMNVFEREFTVVFAPDH